MIAISACLCGTNCRYDGRNSYRKVLMEKLATEDVLPICPEQLGGLPTPRTPARIIGGTGYDVLDDTARVINDEGQDVTGHFLRGAFVALEMLRKHSVSKCYVKDKSPSCGFGKEIEMDNRKIETFAKLPVLQRSRTIGVCAALFDREGIEVIEVSLQFTEQCH
ncbi:MAG: DUF523 domain-containing protein [Pseudomonadota bacterium]